MREMAEGSQGEGTIDVIDEAFDCGADDNIFW